MRSLRLCRMISKILVPRGILHSPSLLLPSTSTSAVAASY